MFVSYARTDWVDVPLAANQCRSGYDLLIIVSQKELTDRAVYWSKAEQWLVREYTIDKTLVAHDLAARTGSEPYAFCAAGGLSGGSRRWEEAGGCNDDE